MSALIANDPDHPAVSRCTNDLAYVVNRFGDYELAEGWYRWVIAVEDKKPSKDELDIAMTMNNLAMALLYQHQPELAEPFLEHARQLREDKAGQHSIGFANSLEARAYSQYIRNDLVEAEKIYRQTLSLKEELFVTPTHTGIAFTQLSLAAVLEDAHRSQEAGRYLELARKAYQERTNTEHPLITWVFYLDRARLFHAQRKLRSSEILYRQALRESRPQAAQDSPQLAHALTGLAKLKCDLGELDEAVHLARESLDMRERLFGEKHPLVAQGLLTLGRSLLAEGRYEDAEALLQQAVEIRASSKPPLPWLEAQAKIEYARSLRGLGLTAQAREIIRTAHETLVAELGTDDPRTTAAAQAVAGEQ